MCCYLVMVGELESLCDSMSYTGRGLSSWQVQLSQAGYGGEDRLKVVPGPPGWGLGVGLIRELATKSEATLFTVQGLLKEKH